MLVLGTCKELFGGFPEPWLACKQGSVLVDVLPGLISVSYILVRTLSIKPSLKVVMDLHRLFGLQNVSHLFCNNF